MQAAKAAGALVSIDLASFELVENCIDTLLRLLKQGLIDLVFANEEEAVALLKQVDAAEASTAGGPLQLAGHGRKLLQCPGNRHIWHIARPFDMIISCKRCCPETQVRESIASIIIAQMLFLLLVLPLVLPLVLVITGGYRQAEDKVQAAQEFVLQYAQVCVVSLGARGCVARARGGRVGTAPAGGVKVVDTIGAGDYFTSGFLYAYLKGCSLQQCAAVGCQAGSAAVQTRGAILSDAAWQQLRSNVEAVVSAAKIEPLIEVVTASNNVPVLV
jgi:sugar/nucleoside kinase (ribokinase family)